MSGEERQVALDQQLLNVAQQCDGIDDLFDKFFSFLLRRTDFYSGTKSTEDARKAVLKAFDRYVAEGEKKRKEEQNRRSAEDAERRRKAEEKAKKDQEEYARLQSENSKKSVLSASPKIEELDDDDGDKAAGADRNGEADHSDGDEGSDGPAAHGNGGKTERYTWTQTLAALEVSVFVPPGTQSKQLSVVMGSDRLKIGLKGQPPIIDGDLHARIKPDDSMWTLVDNKIIQLTLEKYDQMRWWSCVMKGDPEIDTKKIVPENSKLSDLDGEMRTTVEKMMYDQRQKAAGLPTSDQQKQWEMLEQFKKAHPEMDFSNAKINFGGGSGGFNMS